MKLLKVIGLAGLLTLGFSGVASATYLPNHYDYHHGDCGNQGNTCNTPYTQTLSTSNIDTQTHWSFLGKYNESKWSFDAINEPTLNITSATLDVMSTTYLGGALTADSNNSWGFTFLGFLSNGAQSFALSSSLFDEVMAGLSLDAVFSSKYDYVSWSQLTVNGTYCPPVSQVPVPAALWLFAPALMGFTALRRRTKKA